MQIAEILNEVWDKPQHQVGRWLGYDGNYEKEFILNSGKELSIRIEPILENSCVINFYVDGTQQITGTGDAVQIFSIVGNAITDFVRKRQPTLVAFTGYQEQSRIKLYDRIVSRFMKLPAFRSYVNVTNDNFEWPEELESEIDNIQSIENQKLYVLVHSRYFKELYGK